MSCLEMDDRVSYQPSHMVLTENFPTPTGPV